MKVFAAVLALAALLSAAEACKCVSSIGNNEAATRACCQEAGGSASETDCPADDISNNLSRFASCCRQYETRSDCRCPIGCARQELEAQRAAEGKAPPTDTEVNALVASYEN